jgi:hypothetical protein
MSAKVPENNYVLFTATDSIRQAVIDKYGTFSPNDKFSLIVARVVAVGDIADFDATFAPATLAGINRTSHFKNFPMDTSLSYCFRTGTSFDDVCCGVITPCNTPPVPDVPTQGQAVTLTTGVSMADVCCTTFWTQYQ